MRFATWKQWNPVQSPARSSRKRWDECSVSPIWETLWISAIVCNINFFSLETKKPAFYSKVCSAKRMLVKYESGNENQNVIRLKNIIMEANWKINAKFQHKPNAMFRILLVLNFLLKRKAWKNKCPFTSKVLNSTCYTAWHSHLRICFVLSWGLHALFQILYISHSWVHEVISYISSKLV